MRFFDAGSPSEKVMRLNMPPSTKFIAMTLIRTNGTKVPYGESLGNIIINLEDGRVRYVQLKQFRDVQMNWINDRLLYINCNIGHIASVDAILDVEDNKWIYRKSVQFPNE